MKVISWNIACLPDFVNFFGSPKYRLESIINEIKKLDADIICLQEVFSKESREILCKAFKAEYYVRISQKSSNMWTINGGLFIASRYPIIYCKFYVFKHACGEDWLSNKGFIHLMVKDHDSKTISIINTHLNADPMFSTNYRSKKIRLKQMYDIISYIHQIPLEDVNILCGDFNDSYTSKMVQRLISLLKDISKKNLNINSNIFITCENEQVDYIFLYGLGNEDKLYNVISSDVLSDHKIVVCEINHEKDGME